jgi:integrase/recombinase XerD
MKNNSLLIALSEYFFSFLPDVKGLSKNTIISYQYAFQLLYEFLYEDQGLTPDKISFDTFTAENISSYLLWLENNRGCSPTTRNLRRTAILSFAKYALKYNFKEALHFHTELNLVPKKRVPQNTNIKYFTKEEMSIILSLPNNTTTIGKRNTMLLSLLYASGARAQEICDLTLNDLYFGTETNIRLVGKGNKARLVTIPQNCASMLKNYLLSRNIDVSTPRDRLKHVFSSRTHEKMSVSCIEEIVKKYVKQSKKEHPDLFRQKTYTPHSFRHSIAVHMLECGESLVVIKAFLGHSSIMSTTIYASVTPELANKYLRERGQLLNDTTLDSQSNEPGKVGILTFLKKYDRSN